MAFDFRLIPVPFRMQPGLQRITPAQARLTPLVPGTAIYAEKTALLRGAWAAQACLSLPGFDAANALNTIALCASETWASNGFLTENKTIQQPASARQQTAQNWAAESPQHSAAPLAVHNAHNLALQFEEDFCVIGPGPDYALLLACVCSPSHWAPEHKLGQSFAAIHAPVADNASLLAAAGPLLQRLTSGPAAQRYWRRHVWTISPSPRYDQHPLRHSRPAWPAWVNGQDPAQFARQCWLRWECQTLLPVLHADGKATAQTLFTIRVVLEPLAQAVQAPWQAQRLADALASMSPAVLAYKNLDAAREPLLAWLRKT